MPIVNVITRNTFASAPFGEIKYVALTRRVLLQRRIKLQQRRRIKLQYCTVRVRYFVHDICIALINICRMNASRLMARLKFTQMHSGGVEYLASEGIVWFEGTRSINIR